MKSNIFLKLLMLGGLALAFTIGAECAFATQLTNVQLGTPPGPGSFSYDGATNSYTLTGQGGLSSVGNQSTVSAFGDFAYTAVTGDFSISAVVSSYTTGWAGILAMNSLNTADMDAGSFYDGQLAQDAAQYVSSYNGTYQRATISGTSTGTWLRLTRSGNVFSEYASVTGSSWSLISSETIPMLNTIYAGLFVDTANYSTTTTSTSTFSSVSIPATQSGSASSVTAPATLGLLALSLIGSGLLRKWREGLL